MTAFFVKTFKKRHTKRCAHCRKDKVSGYSLCDRHLVAARERFRSWSNTRRKEHKCILCDRKPMKTWLRCRLHTKINRNRCAIWGSQHPDYAHKQWLKRKKYIDVGLCVCRAHNPLPVGKRRCDPCRTRSAGYEAQSSRA